MKTFYISVTETLKRTVEVHATDVCDAIQKVSDAYHDEQIVLDSDDYVLASDGNIKIKRSLVYESFCQVGEALRIWFVDEEDPLHTYRVVKVTDDEVIAEFIK